MKFIPVACAVALFVFTIATFAEAQLPVASQFTGATVQLYAPNVDPVAGTPTQTVPTMNFACNIAGPIPATPNPLINPGTIWFTDQVNAGRFCVGLYASALPANTLYLATVTGTWSGGVTGRSAASNPFNIQAIQVAPGVPTGLAIRP